MATLTGDLVDHYEDETDIWTTLMKANETLRDTTLQKLNAEVSKYETLVAAYTNYGTHSAQTYTDLVNEKEDHMTEYYRLRNETESVEKTFSMLFESFTMLTDQLKAISKTTGFQAVIYDEQENFQSFEILENFNYPFSNRKQVRDEYYAMMPKNHTSKAIQTHKLYLQNSVVCLQSNWWKVFGFVEQGVTFIVNIVKKNAFGEDDNKKPSVKYECGNPFVKLKF